MPEKSELLKVGRQGILVRTSRIPASFFRHRQPGKRFVVLAGGDRRLMHVRVADKEAIRLAYRGYIAGKSGCEKRSAAQ